MNESEQAQAIAEIKAVRDFGEFPRPYYREIIDKALEIVDSQAQKIAEQAKEISAQNVEIINLRYHLQTARIQAEGLRSDIICGETSYLRQYLDGHEFPWEKL